MNHHKLAIEIIELVDSTEYCNSCVPEYLIELLLRKHTDIKKEKSASGKGITETTLGELNAEDNFVFAKGGKPDYLMKRKLKGAFYHYQHLNAEGWICNGDGGGNTTAQTRVIKIELTGV